MKDYTVVAPLDNYAVGREIQLNPDAKETKKLLESKVVILTPLAKAK